ncbi:MAG: ABC-F family ATP-binding cassette domain-containing protein [Rikenellaceae bacterium]
MANYLQVENLTKSFGERTLFKGLSFGIESGQRVSLIAKNGMGKSTLLDIIMGKSDADSGTVTTMRDLRISYLAQDPKFESGLSVREACFGIDTPTLRAINNYHSALNSSNEDALQDAINQMDNLSAWDYEARVEQILTKLNIKDLDQKVDTLSGGQRKKIALAGVLLSQSELIILDEPTNHLDTEVIDWLEQYLANSSASLLMVTHDRYFLDRVCNRIIELESSGVYSYNGNFSYYLTKREERYAAAAAQQRSDRNLFKKELEWMRRQPQARATKAKSRIDAFYKLEDRLHSTSNELNVKIEVKAGYVGSKIFEATNLSKSFGDIKLFKNFNYKFARKDKLGIVGNNGSGKSTFLKMLMGEIQPDTGTIEVGESIKMGYYSQNGIEFDPTLKVIDTVTAIAEQISLGDGRTMSASQFLQYFLFAPAVQHNLVAKLSGGERRRLYLCTILMQNPNFLVLDEPTNDLDIITLQVLEEYLQSFTGCLIVVSHDRFFMDKVVDHLLIFTPDNEVKDFAGNYTDYLDWKLEYEAQNKAKQSSEPKKQTQVKKEQPRKLTFKEKFELEELDALIPQLEQQKSELESELSSGTLSSEELQAKSLEIGELIEEIDLKSMRWLELSEI